MPFVTPYRLLILLAFVVFAPVWSGNQSVSGSAIPAAHAQTVTPTCPRGYTFSGNTCVKSSPAPSCPSGYVFSGGQCVVSSSNGQWAFVVTLALGVKTALELDGAAICIISGSPSQAATESYFRTNRLNVSYVPGNTLDAVIQTYDKAACDVLVVEANAASATIDKLSRPNIHGILPERIGGTVAASPPPIRPAAPPIVQAPTVNLALPLQQELKRIGCLTGRVDGVWGRGSRAALRRFAGRAGLNLGTEPTQNALNEARRRASGFCAPVRVAPKRPKTKGCRSGTVFLEGQCIPKSQVQSYCGPGFVRKGSKCVHTSEQQQSAPKPKTRCSAIKFAFTRGNTCACSGGRIFTGSHCEKQEDIEIVPVKPQPSGQCRAGAKKKQNQCYYKCVCEMLGCSWKIDACH